MASFDLFSNPGTRHDGLVAQFHGLASRVRQDLACRAMYHRTVAELAALSDAELADIGLTRGTIRSVAREACATV
jgi:uncharacterized protein YjiS (DUF1127 family)